MKYKEDKTLRNECVECDEEKELCTPIDCDELVEGKIK